jgi:2-keto-4-pentenoate hydratase/2-oxohepta-3-ene-1,7-dioic acid hydratase in catechol pathway
MLIRRFELKLLYFNDFRLGVIRGNDIVDITDCVIDIPHVETKDIMKGLIENFSVYREKIEQMCASADGIPFDSVKIRPPLPKPDNIDCMARNYIEDGNHAVLPAINAFHKTSNAIIGDGDVMLLPDAPAKVFEAEAEFAVVIGKRATGVTADKAMDHVFGYVNFVDGSARGLPPSDNTFYQGKCRDTFAPIGPYIVTADEVGDPNQLQLKLWVNGTLKQDFNSSDIAHKIPRCIEWVSAIHTLEPGDLIATGTNHFGLGAIQDGDVIELEVESLGRLRVTVKDPLKREWTRETRQQRKVQGHQVLLAPQIGGKYTPSSS